MEDNNNLNIIHQNEYFIFYISGNQKNNLYLNSQSKEIQEKYDSDDIMSHEQKLQKVDEILEYFYNFWKLVEKSNDNKIYTLNLNINLVMINIPVEYYIKVKNILDSLKNVFEIYLKETYFKIDNKLAKYFLDIILTLYKPIKPVHLIN